MMAERQHTPVKVQAFPQQKLTGLPKDKDIELTMVPRQVIQFQGIRTDQDAPKLTVTVDSAGRSKLHYTPADCRAGDAACVEGEGLQEIWVPETRNPFAQFTVRGMSSPARLRIPREFFDSSLPFKVLTGELPGPSSPSGSPSLPIESGGNPVPEELDDFFIGMADEKNALKNSGLKEGGNDWSDLSEAQRAMLRSLVKEVVAAGGVILDEQELIRDFGFRGKFYLKNQGGKTYVIFKGYAGLRKFYRGTRYALSKNYSRLSILTIKQGPMEAMKQAIPKGTKGTAIGFLFMGFVNTWAWLSEDSESRFISDLLIDIGSDAVKGIAGGLVASALIGVGALMVGATVPVFAVIAGAVGLGIFFGLTLDYLDGKAGATEAVKKVGRKAEIGMRELWKDCVENPFNTLLNRIEWEVKQAYGLP